MKFLLRSIGAFHCCIFFLSCTGQVNNTIAVEQFEKSILSKDSIQILDVRTPLEYASGHIKDALLADWTNKEEFARRTAFIDKNKPVYVYCLAGGRSALAAEQLKANGYAHVYNLDGGIKAWKAAGKLLDVQTTTPQMTLDAFSQAVNVPGIVLVDFGAKWCPPCKMMEPILQRLQTEQPGKFNLLKVDGGNDELVMKAYNVTTLPVFIIFKNGKQVWRKDGVASEEELKAQLKN